MNGDGARLLVLIAYSLGDVVLVPFPFTDQTTSKKRPAVVVSAEAYHQRRIRLFCGSPLPPFPTNSTAWDHNLDVFIKLDPRQPR
jgi:hypothetical protein